MRRMVVSYGTGDFLVGLERLDAAVLGELGANALMMPWGIGPWKHLSVQHKNAGAWPIPASWPTHQQKPFAFKAYALKAAMDYGADLLLWCDCCILPIRSLEPLWERIERDGYWMSRNGFTNYEWTANSAYPDLFPEAVASQHWDEMRSVNRGIEHVVAGCFGINVRHPIGKAFLEEYYRLASETNAFCGPWTNTSRTPCGPSDVRGHRHDQTAASVIAWRLGMKLTSPPNIFAYSKRRADKTLHLEDQDQSTLLLADGSMHDGNVL